MSYKLSKFVILMMLLIGCQDAENVNNINSPQNETAANNQLERLPDFANPEAVVSSALDAWEAGDNELFKRHFYLGAQDSEPALDALSSCDFQGKTVSFDTSPATDIGPQMSNVTLLLDGTAVGTFLVIDANRYRITTVRLNCNP